LTCGVAAASHQRQPEHRVSKDSTSACSRRDERVHQTESIERAANLRNFAIDYTMIGIRPYGRRRASSFDSGD